MASRATAAADSTAAPPRVALTPIAQRLSRLRELAATEPARAQEETWSWIKELGQTHDEEALNELFELGIPSRGLDGQTEGILVTFTMHPIPDRVIRAITGAWMPWLGKRFNADEGSGDNVLASSARWPAKLLWPLYVTQPSERGRAAFDFETAVEPSRSESDVEALKIDYGAVESNPRLIVRRIRDELVELVPGAHLGKMLWRQDSEPYPCLAYFALRQPLPDPAG
jgi:hypothetical protein